MVLEKGSLWGVGRVSLANFQRGGCGMMLWRRGGRGQILDFLFAHIISYCNFAEIIMATPEFT